MVNDGVENSLMREVDTIKDCQMRMKRTLEQVNHQLGVNRSVVREGYVKIVALNAYFCLSMYICITLNKMFKFSLS